MKLSSDLNSFSKNLKNTISTILVISDLEGANFIKKLFSGLDRVTKIYSIIFFSEDPSLFTQLQHVQQDINNTSKVEYDIEIIK